MGYMITAVGAGGKTTYLRKRALEYLRMGRSAVITTTTHIWMPHEGLFEQKKISLDGDDQSYADAWMGLGKEPDYYGHLEQSGKLAALSDEELSCLSGKYDVVLVEGDGSHCMPVKIPGAGEPVVPQDTDEIVVVMGAHAIGRRIDVVCHRFREDMSILCDEAGIVTEKLLEEIAEKYYLTPLRAQYPRAELSYVLSRMPGVKGKVAAVVMASGFGRRYGGNKLLDTYDGKALYCHTLEHVTQAMGQENVVVVTQYSEILDEVSSMGIDAIMNRQAQEGIAASIRLGTKWALEKGADAVIFFAADMPNLPSSEIGLYAEQFLDSGKTFGCMVFGPEHTCSNPGAFRLDYGAQQLMNLTGDRGAMRIMKKEPWNIYYYQIAPECCVDIDRKRSRTDGEIE